MVIGLYRLEVGHNLGFLRELQGDTCPSVSDRAYQTLLRCLGIADQK